MKTENGFTEEGVICEVCGSTPCNPNCTKALREENIELKAKLKLARGFMHDSFIDNRRILLHELTMVDTYKR